MSDSPLQKITIDEIRALYDEPIYLVSEDKKIENDDRQKIKLSTLNRKKILIVHAENSQHHKSSKNRDLLLNILKSIDIGVDDYQEEVCGAGSLSEILSLTLDTETSSAICFGWPASEDGAQKYQVLHRDNAHFLLADSLEDIQKDVNLKRALWGCLKELFL